MSRVTASISVSLDGFVAGRNDGPENPLGDGGLQLHEWVIKLRGWRQQHGLEGGEPGPESDIVSDEVRSVGAWIMGHRMFTNGEPHWGDDPPFHLPVFVVTHHSREPIVKAGGTSYTFVHDGIERVLEVARSSAEGRNIRIAGGANVIQQHISAGLLDELRIDLVPILLGGGVRLFEGLDHLGAEFRIEQVLAAPAATHITYTLTRGDRASD